MKIDKENKERKLYTWKGKENPSSHFWSSSKTAKIKFSNGHSNCVLYCGSNIFEVPQTGVEHKVEEAAERPKHNDELNHKSWQTREAKFDGSCNLFEGLLETKSLQILIKEYQFWIFLPQKSA